MSHMEHTARTCAVGTRLVSTAPVAFIALCQASMACESGNIVGLPDESYVHAAHPSRMLVCSKVAANWRALGDIFSISRLMIAHRCFTSPFLWTTGVSCRRPSFEGRNRRMSEKNRRMSERAATYLYHVPCHLLLFLLLVAAEILCFHARITKKMRGTLQEFGLWVVALENVFRALLVISDTHTHEERFVVGVVENGLRQLVEGPKSVVPYWSLLVRGIYPHDRSERLAVGTTLQNDHI